MLRHFELDIIFNYHYAIILWISYKIIINKENTYYNKMRKLAITSSLLYAAATIILLSQAQAQRKVVGTPPPRVEGGYDPIVIPLIRQKDSSQKKVGASSEARSQRHENPKGLLDDDQITTKENLSMMMKSNIDPYKNQSAGHHTPLKQSSRYQLSL